MRVDIATPRAHAQAQHLVKDLNANRKCRQKEQTEKSVRACARDEANRKNRQTQREKVRREKVRSLQGKRALRVEQVAYAAQLPTVGTAKRD